MAARTDSTPGASGPAPVPVGARADSTPATRGPTGPAPGGPQKEKKAREPENAIEQVLDRPQTRSTGAKKAESPNEVRRDAESTSQAMPGHISTRYVQVGNQYYFPNRDLAFKDQGNRLSTRLENTELISDLVETAKVRGWTQIAIAGSKAFKSEAWQQAKMAGLTVRNYQPSKLEEALLERRMGKDRDATAGRDTDSAAGASPSEWSMSPAAAEEAARQSARQLDQVPVKGGVYTGKLVRQGNTHYRNDPNEDLSDYIVLRTPERERELWGNDFDRAIRESLSKVKVGDEVSARFLGSEPVTVTRPVRNAQGQVVRETRVKTHFNRWSVETTEFLRERAELANVVRNEKIDKETAVRRNPALAGAYTELHVAELKAKEQYKNQADRTRFVASTRERLAAGIERGERLPATRVPARAATRTPRQDRDLVQERALG